MFFEVTNVSRLSFLLNEISFKNVIITILDKIKRVANLSHPVNVSVSNELIVVSLAAFALDRDIILDIDLPNDWPSTRVILEPYNNTSTYALIAFTPHLLDFPHILSGKDDANSEFIFIGIFYWYIQLSTIMLSLYVLVDCSGSMTDENKIGLARETMLLFIRSLPMGSHFNIIRFGSSFDILFKNELVTVIYDEDTAKKAEDLTRTMRANFGGTELLEPLKHLKSRPPVQGRSRQIFLLTDGEISNTDEVRH